MINSPFLKKYFKLTKYKNHFLFYSFSVSESSEEHLLAVMEKSLDFSQHSDFKYFWLSVNDFPLEGFE